MAGDQPDVFREEASRTLAPIVLLVHVRGVSAKSGDCDHASRQLAAQPGLGQSCGLGLCCSGQDRKHGWLAKMISQTPPLLKTLRRPASAVQGRDTRVVPTLYVEGLDSC